MRPSEVKAGISVADISAAMYALTGVLTALYERERTGVGTSVEVAMLDALGEWMSQPYLYSRYGGSPPTRPSPRTAPTGQGTAPKCSSGCRTSVSGPRCAPTCWSGPI